jgi:chromosome segregation ATPase
LAEAWKARDAATQQADKAKEEETTLRMKLEVTNNQLVQALEKAQENLDRERKAEAEAAKKISELSSQLEWERVELARVRPLLSAEEKVSTDLRAKLASSEEATNAAVADFEYAA